MMRIFIVVVGIFALFLVGCGGSSSTGGAASAQGSAAGGGTGKGGSMARFAIKGDYLYTVNRDAMRVFDISEPSHPYPYSKVHVPFDVETLFSYKEYLYIGGESGMYIYDASIASQPTKIGAFTHTRSCDPVVVWKDLAFVTLNSGGWCRLNDGENTLQIIDIHNPSSPKLLKTVGMWSPRGLGIDEDGTLFVCDGSAGLKIFSVFKEEENLSKEVRVRLEDGVQKTLTGVDCYDLIPYQKGLVVSDRVVVRQFDYSHFPMVELSQIK